MVRHTDRIGSGAIRAAQKARHERVTEWALGKLRELRDRKRNLPARDMGFVVYRTYANPATLDGTIDPNDRPATGTIYGNAQAVNFSAAMYGRFTTLTSYLSQWSPISIAASGLTAARSLPLPGRKRPCFTTSCMLHKCQKRKFDRGRFPQGCKIARNFDPTPKAAQRIDLVAKAWD
jgi:hypothetical protein